MPETAARIELIAANGTTSVALKLVAVEREVGDRVVAESKMFESLSASDADSPLADWLEPQIQETWIGGAGVHYNAAPGCVTRIGGRADGKDIGYVMPGPLENGASLPGPNNSDSEIVAIEEYGGNTYFAQRGAFVANEARVMRTSSIGTPSLSDVLTLGANDQMTDLMVFDNGSWAGTKWLWASSNEIGVGGRLSYYDGATWTSTASGNFGANQRSWLAKQFWVTGGVGSWRMIAGNGNNRVSYTVPFGNPAVAADWVEGVDIETAGAIRRPATAVQAIFMPSIDGLFYLDEQGVSHNLTSYVERMQHPYNGFAAYYLDGYVYYSLGQGIDRVYVGEQGILQELPGQCVPGAFTASEHEFGGWCTAMTGDQGWLVAAFFNPLSQRASIWWGKDRKYFPGVDTANPLVWHGPEIVSNTNQFVTAMRTVADLTNNVLRLWVAATPYGAGAIGTSTPSATWFTLPMVGQPLSELMTSSTYRFATGSSTGNWQPYNRLLSMPYTWGDKNSKKIIHELAAGNRGVSAADGATLRVFQRADPTPGSTNWGSGVDITTPVTQTIEPTTTTSGYKLEYRVDFFATNGAASPPKVGVLDAVRWTAWRVAPAFPVLTITVEYPEHDSQWSPEQIKAYLEELTESTRTTMRLPNDKRYRVKLRQVLDSERILDGGESYQEKIRSKIQIALLGAA